MTLFIAAISARGTVPPYSNADVMAMSGQLQMMCVRTTTPRAARLQCNSIALCAAAIDWIANDHAAARTNVHVQAVCHTPHPTYTQICEISVVLTVARRIIHALNLIGQTGGNELGEGETPRIEQRANSAATRNT